MWRARQIAVRCTQHRGTSIDLQTRWCPALAVLGRRLWSQHGASHVRHDPRAGFNRTWGAAGVLRRAGRLGNLPGLWIARHSRLLSSGFRPRAAVSQRTAHGLEEGLALAPPMAVLTSACRHGLASLSLSSIYRRSPRALPAPFL